VDHQEVETDADWAVEADHLRQEDIQQKDGEEDVVAAAAGSADIVAAAVGNAAAVEDPGAVVVEDPGAVVGLGYKREVVVHPLLQAAVHESHQVVAADLLHPEMAVEALSYVALDHLALFPSVEVHHHLREEVE
jgi:hypothetical protein